tara:strand:- start:2293 stop:4827 length:2535 start_codon:yes stop_codon:yes gene_type:complete
VLKHFSFLLFISCFAFAGVSQKPGVPLITNYEPSDYVASPQNWGVTQMESGEMLFANDFGLLIYNGRQWKTIEEEVGFNSKSILKKGSSIYLGCENNVFRIKTDSGGSLIFKSILPSLPDSIAEFGMVDGLLSVGNQIAFHSKNFLFILNDDEFEYAYTENNIISIFSVKGQIYASVEDRGLLRLENELLVPILGYQNFLDNRPISMVQVKGGINVLTENNGSYFIEIDTYGYERKVTKIETEIDLLFENKKLARYFKINDQLQGVSTENSGLYLVKNWKTIEYHLDIDNGLIDEYVHDVSIDRFGSLWLALNNGISKVDISYPIQVFDNRSGLEGMVESMVLHENQVYAATHSGVYSLKNGANKFTEALPIQAWDLLSFSSDAGSKLLVATNEDISEYTSSGQLKTIVECYPWKLYQPTKPKNTVLIGTDPGLTAIKWEGEKWVVGHESPEVLSEIGNFCEDKNGIWMGTRGSEPYLLAGLSWNNDSTIFGESTSFDRSSTEIGDGEVNTFKWKGEVLFGTSSGIFQHNNGKFQLNTSITGLDSLALVHRAYNWKDQELWAIAYTNGQFQYGFADQNNNWNYRLFSPIAKDIVHSILPDQDNDMLFGGAGGIYKYNKGEPFDIEQSYNCILNKVTVLEDSLIHNGFWQDTSGLFSTNQPEWAIPRFHYKVNAIAFEYSSVTFGDEEDISYSYWLEGNDKRWSKWTKEHKKEYTNLPPGNYRFKVKAINVLGTESQIAEYRFTVLKPWFQSPWYYGAQTAVLALLVFLTVFLNRSGNPSPFSSVIAFVTIITVFEFIIMTIEPFFIEYTDEIPVFNLIMNILMAMSLAPVEKMIRNFLAKRNHE